MRREIENYVIRVVLNIKDSKIFENDSKGMEEINDKTLD